MADMAVGLSFWEDRGRRFVPPVPGNSPNAGLSSRERVVQPAHFRKLAVSEWVIEHNERWHEIHLNGVTVHNLYLSPYSAAERREEREWGELAALAAAAIARQRE